MPSIFTLIDSACEAYDNPNFRKPGATWCNLATQYVCEKMGYTKFSGMVANEMVQLMRDSKEWEAIPIGSAQAFANSGMLVISGAQDHPHGHVVVVRPGVAQE